MQENVEEYLAKWRNFTAEILKEPEKSFISFKKSLNSNNIHRFEEFFSEVEKNYLQRVTSDKIILLFLATSLAIYYYEATKEEPNDSDKEDIFTQKMEGFHKLLCLDNTLSDENKAKLSALVGYGGIAINYFYLAMSCYKQAINFQEKALSVDSPKHLREYYFQLSVAYFNHGCKVHKQFSFLEEEKLYNKTIKAAKKGLEQKTEYKKNEGWFYVSRATYSLAVLYYHQKKWNEVTQLLNKLILACSSGLETHMNSQKKVDVFLGYISNSLQLISNLLEKNSIEKESRQAIEKSLIILKTTLVDLLQEGVSLSNIKEKICQIETSIINLEDLNSYSIQFWSSNSNIQANLANEAKTTNDENPLKPLTIL